MRKEKKKLISYALALALSATTLLSGSIPASAATLKVDRSDVTTSGQPVTVTTDSDGQTVYTLTGNVTEGLALTLDDNETAILDGNGFTVTATSDYYGNYSGKPNTGLQVLGSGTLILKNITIIGGDASFHNEPMDNYGIIAGAGISLIFRDTAAITIASGNPCTHSTKDGSNHPAILFEGDKMVFEANTNVTLNGSDSSYFGASCGLDFRGKQLLISEDISKLLIYGGNGSDSLSGAAAIEFDGKLFQLPASAYYKTDLVAGADITDSYGNPLTALSPAPLVMKSGLIPADVLNMLITDYKIGTTDSSGSAVKLSMNDFYTIRFYTPGRTAPVDYAVRKDYAMIESAEDLPSVTDTAKYILKGWYTDADLTQEASFPLTLTEDTTLYANCEPVECHVTFDTNGGSAIPAQTIAHGSALTAPDTSREGYTFGGWFTDAALTKAYDFNTPVNSHLTLYAKWNVNSYQVSFNSNGGSKAADQTVNYNTAAAAPTVTKTGYAFGGWFTDAALTKAYNFNTPVTSDLTLYAKWNVNSYQVTFNSNGGSKVTAQTIKYQNTVKKPANPTKKNAVFGGWYTDKSCKTAFGFNTKITGNRTLYAKWYTIKVSSSKLSLTEGDTYKKLKTTLTSGDSVKSYSTSDKKIVTVDKKGVLTAKKAGKATITIKTKKGLSTKVTVTVKKKIVKTTKLTVSNVKKNAVTVKKGKTFTLKATAAPKNSTEKITYSTSNKKVATVSSSGKIKGIKKGTATITVKSGTKSVKIKVTVK